jgi:hypothetical protein
MFHHTVQKVINKGIRKNELYSGPYISSIAEDTANPQ